MPFRDKIVDKIVTTSNAQLLSVDEDVVRALVDEIVNIVHTTVITKKSLTILGFGKFKYVNKHLKPSVGKRARTLDIFRWSISSQRNRQLSAMYTNAITYYNNTMQKVRDNLTTLLNDSPIKSSFIADELVKAGYPRRLSLLSIHVFFSSILIETTKSKNVTICDLGTFTMRRRIINDIITVKFVASGKARVITFKEPADV